MSLTNIYALTRTVILADMFLKGTGDKYKVVSAHPYPDKKGVLPDDYRLTLKVLTDSIDYDFDEQHSYAIGFDLILRYKNYEKLSLNEDKRPAK